VRNHAVAHREIFADTDLRDVRSESRSVRIRRRRRTAIIDDMTNHETSTESVAHELRHLEQVAEVGESDKTPLILTGGVAIACTTVFLIVLVVSLLAYRLAA
jgi:hypothetical protein